MQVIKRDGRKQDFSCLKIYTAIINACEAIDGTITDESKDLAKKISDSIGESLKKDATVEEIFEKFHKVNDEKQEAIYK